MALIVEDGTGLANAESFISVAAADTYHANRGNTVWAGADAVKEAALRRATDFMQQTFRTRWKSFRVTSTQALDWPRAWVELPDAPYGYGSFAAYVPNNVVPTEVKNACAELALAALSENLNPALDRTTSKETVGPISVEYDESSPEYKRYRNVDMLLAPYLTGSSVSVGLVRT
jgi:hypothetical protein